MISKIVNHQCINSYHRIENILYMYMYVNIEISILHDHINIHCNSHPSKTYLYIAYNVFKNVSN